ncbi:MAG: Coenzyme F420 hydrogenase/dehydrogenase, beta subunit C-terminal domain [Thermodesulfobacteriota bacterium]
MKTKSHVISMEGVPACFSRIGDDECAGCASCANACPQSAIVMKLNQEGFYRPVLQEGRCNDCMACLRYCPVIEAMERPRIRNEVSEIYAAWSTDEEIHLASSSGGVFSEVARNVLSNSGAVCGCEWGDNWTPRHIMVRNWDNLARLRGSKYIPSYIDERFHRGIIDLAKAGTTILFCGTPCQVAGLDLIAPTEARKNLLLMDLVCHGVPSLKSFWSYLDWKFGGRNQLGSFSFRNKEISSQTICGITRAGDKYLIECGKDTWFRSAMVYHLFLQKSCFGCRFGSIPRSGDITVGDFWGIPEDWHDQRGDSVVFANTRKGKDVIGQLIRARHVIAKESEYATASKNVGRLRGTIYPRPIFRKLALAMIENGDYNNYYKFCYLPLSFAHRVIAAAKRRGLIRSDQ